jgi:hypothetical protein
MMGFHNHGVLKLVMYIYAALCFQGLNASLTININNTVTCKRVFEQIHMIVEFD